MAAPPEPAVVPREPEISDPDAVARPADVRGASRLRWASRWRVHPVERLARRTIVVDAAAIVALSLLGRWLFTHAVPDTDPTFALIWGQDILHGHLPDFAHAAAPTAHPLPTLEGVLAGVLGRDGGASALLVLSYASFGALLWGLFRLGAALASWPVGLLALVIVGSNFASVDVTTGAFLDAQFSAIVIWAIVLELRQPRRGMPVLWLLSLAALVRPEAWPLACAYSIWAMRGRGKTMGTALALLAAPLAWILMDLVVTGQPLFAFTNARRSDEGQALGGSSSNQLLTFAVDQLRNAVTAPVLVGGTAGLLVAWRLRLRSALVPAGMLLLLLAGFGGLVLLRLPVPDRMLLTPAAVFAVFCALGALGWIGTAPGRRPLIWTVGGLAMVALLIVTADAVVVRLQHLNARRAGMERALGDLAALRGGRAGGVLAACRTVSVSADELVPYTSYYLERPLQRVALVRPAAPAPGAYLRPTRPAAKVLLGWFQHDRGTAIPAGSRFVAGNRSWQVYTNGC